MFIISRWVYSKTSTQFIFYNKLETIFNL